MTAFRVVFAVLFLAAAGWGTGTYVVPPSAPAPLGLVSAAPLPGPASADLAARLDALENLVAELLRNTKSDAPGDVGGRAEEIAAAVGALGLRLGTAERSIKAIGRCPATARKGGAR